MVKIIGFSGKKGSGKTLLASEVCVHFNMLRMSFAEPIKHIGLMFGCSFESMYHDRRLATPFAMSGRDFLQKLGDGVRRTVSQDFWLIPAVLKMLMVATGKTYRLSGLHSGIQELKRSKGSFVFDDVRYSNEVELIESLGGRVFRLTRCIDSGDRHASETELDLWTWKKSEIIDNANLTLPETVERCLALVHEMDS